MPGDDCRHADSGCGVFTAVEGRVGAATTRHGAACSRASSRSRYGHDEETIRLTGCHSGSHTSTRSAFVAAPAERHGHQVRSVVKTNNTFTLA